MRGWWPLIASVAAMLVAWLGDRVLVWRAVEVGMSPDRASSLALVPIAAGAAFALLVVALGWLVFRGPTHWLAGIGMIVIGAYIGIVVGGGLALGAVLPLAPDAWEAPMLRSVAAFVMVLGLVGLVRPQGRVRSQVAQTEPMRAWLPFALSVPFVVLGYAAAEFVSDAVLELASGMTARPFVVEGVYRVGVAAVLVGLMWVVFAGPRWRVVGTCVFGTGLVSIAAVSVAGGTPLSGSVVALLGLVMLVHPTGDVATQTALEPSTDPEVDRSPR